MNVRECALSDHDGDSTFQYVKEWPGWSGLRRQPYPTAAQPQTIPIKVRRLDSEIPETERIAFIKIDVEGAELEVLRGAHGILSRDRPAVYFECARIHHEQYETTPLLVHDFLRSCEMAVFLLDETGPLTAQQFADAYEGSHRSGYDRTAWGNYLSLPVQPR
jgi:hypothetical protein